MFFASGAGDSHRQMVSFIQALAVKHEFWSFEIPPVRRKCLGNEEISAAWSEECRARKNLQRASRWHSEKRAK